MGAQEFDHPDSVLSSDEDSSNCLVLSWHALSVRVRKQEKKHSLRNVLQCCGRSRTQEFKILDDVHGRAESGSLTAIMGASGCGKTTLLTSISKRIVENVEGRILLNGEPINRNILIQCSGFVAEKDIAFNTLTSLEHLYFMSQMKMESSADYEQRHQQISFLLSEFGLSSLKDVRLSALSGGEKKRLSIAAELLNDPPVLFCDEPTTGLDSYNAITVVESLEALVRRGKIIICSIHQSTSEIFSCFQNLILLSRGRVAYHGPVRDVLEYFSNLGHPCPPAYNPADFLITKVTTGPGDEEAGSTFAQWLCSEFSDSYMGRILRYERENKNHPPRNIEKHLSARNSSWSKQFYWLLWRNVIDSKRTKLGLTQDIAVFLITSVLLAVFYMDISSSSQWGIQDVHGLLYLISSEVFFTSTYRVLSTFPSEIAVLKRECNLYPASAYYLGKIITMIPRLIIEPSLFLAIICIAQMISGSRAISYITLLGPTLISAFSASAYGCMLSTLFENPDMASVVSVPLDLLCLLMAGMFFNIRSLPASISWMKYLSQLHYTNEVFSVLQWQNVQNIECPLDANLPCLATGKQVLELYGYTESNIGLDLLALTLMCLTLHLIGYFAICRRTKKMTVY